MKIVNYQKKECIPLTNEENKSYKKQKVRFTCKKELTDHDEKKYHKVRDHCHYTGEWKGPAHKFEYLGENIEK